MKKVFACCLLINTNKYIPVKINASEKTEWSSFVFNDKEAAEIYCDWVNLTGEF